MKVMIRRSPETGLSIYVPKKDLEEPIVESEHEIAVGRLDPHRQRLGARPAGDGGGHPLPITVNARKRGDEESED